MSADDFDPAKIEQMRVEFVECDNCPGGYGWIRNGFYIYRCSACHGTGVISVEKEGEHE